MLLNNQQITEKIKKEIKICIEVNENENTPTPNLWDTVKAVLRGRFITIQAYHKKQEKSKKKKKSNSTPKVTRKEKEIIPSIFSDHNAVRLDLNYRRKTIKNSNIWRLNNMLLNNQYITEEIKKEIKICIEMNENENTTTQNL